MQNPSRKVLTEFPTCSCSVCGAWEGVQPQGADRGSHGAVSGWRAISATPARSASSCLPAVSACAVPGHSLCSEKPQMPPLPLVSSVHASPGPTCHTWHPSNDLQCTCCCWNYLFKSPLWEGGPACSFTAVLPVPRTVPALSRLSTPLVE